MPYVGLPDDADISSIPAGGYAGLPDDAIAPTLSRKDQVAKGASMTPKESSDYMAQRAAFANQGGVKMFAKTPATDTRKISYTDSGYKPNKPATSLKEFAKNAVQDVVEAPLFPVRMASDIINAPDTLGAMKDTAKSLVTTPLGFVPYVSEMATGRTAADNWLTNPGLGAMTVLGGAELAKKGYSGVSQFAKEPNIGRLTAKMDNEFTKAVRPSVANTRTGAQAADFADRARTAVKEIVLNKDGLGLTNEYGEPVQGLPKNLTDFRQAIDSTKRNLWRQVEDINTAAGENGAAVPLDSAANELRALADNPVYKTMEPNTISYAQQRADALTKQGSFTVGEAQDAVTLANQSLKSFYQNPTPDAASRAYVDSLIANHLRSNLDAALEQATGTPAAHGLRQAYGSLKAIERDVNQRATVDARKNQRGLADFSDIFTAGELVNALASFNPAGIAKAGAMGAVKGLIKHLNDPNTHVKRLFNAADKLVSGVDIPKPEPYRVDTVARPQTVLDAEALPRVSNSNLGDVIPEGYQQTYDWSGKPPAPGPVANPEALPPRPLATNLGDELRPNDYAPVHGWEGKQAAPMVANPEALPPRQSSQMSQLSEQGGRIVPHVEAMTPRVPEGFNPEVIGPGPEDVQLGDRIAPKPRPLRNIPELQQNTDAQISPVAGLSEPVDTSVSPDSPRNAAIQQRKSAVEEYQAMLDRDRPIFSDNAPVVQPAPSAPTGPPAIDIEQVGNALRNSGFAEPDIKAVQDHLNQVHEYGQRLREQAGVSRDSNGAVFLKPEIQEAIDTVMRQQAQAQLPAAHTWQSYLAAHMSRAMKETGDHGKAMKLLGEEWRKDKSKDPLDIRGGKQ